MKAISFLALTVLISALLFFSLVPIVVDWKLNSVAKTSEINVSDWARHLHQALIIGDWHADSALWSRDLSLRNVRGHLDIPRMQEGNIAIQMFTTVTRASSDSSYTSDGSEFRDDITMLAIAQRWPLATWKNLRERALFQAKKLNNLAQSNQKNFIIIRTQKDLKEFLQMRQSNPTLVGGLIGTEGSHALNGKLDNVQYLFDHGFRMMSLHHFFDNALGASLHGETQIGLTSFGRQALAKMQELDIIVDVAHSSEQVVRDVLAAAENPVILSHTGLYGHCPSPRNISDQLMVDVAEAGGLIAVGYWDGAVCGNTPDKVAEAIAFGVQLLGEDHVSLGSDFDGSISTSFDASELVLLTQSLLNQGLSERQIRKVMGGNMVAFLQTYLPKS